MNRKFIIDNNDASFRRTFDKILDSHQINNIQLKNCITKKPSTVNGTSSDIQTYIHNIKLNMPYKKICINIHIEAGQQSMDVECKPYIGSA